MITIGFSTRSHNQEYIDYLQKTSMYKDVEIIEKVNNGEKSLSQVYNEILEESKYDIVVLCHDDLEFDTKNWGDKVLNHFTKDPDYGILGLAGTKYMSKNGKWWEVQNTMYGIVNHKHQGKKWTSTYSQNIGNKIEDAIVVDGLFIALNKKLIKHKFHETFNGFHFYDIGFSFPNYLDGMLLNGQLKIPRLMLFAALCAGVCLSAVAKEAPKLKPRRVEIEYIQTTNPAHEALYARVKEARILERFKVYLSPLRLPTTLTLVMSDCGAKSNAWYYDAEHAVIVCYEYVAVVVAQLAGIGQRHWRHTGRSPERAGHRGVPA